MTSQNDAMYGIVFKIRKANLYLIHLEMFARPLTVMWCHFAFQILTFKVFASTYDLVFSCGAARSSSQLESFQTKSIQVFIFSYRRSIWTVSSRSPSWIGMKCLAVFGMKIIHNVYVEWRGTSKGSLGVKSVRPHSCEIKKKMIL